LEGRGGRGSGCAAKAGCDRARDLTAAEVRVAAASVLQQTDYDVLGDEALGDEAAQSCGGPEQGVVASAEGCLLDSFGLAAQNGVYVGRGVWKHQR